VPIRLYERAYKAVTFGDGELKVTRGMCIPHDRQIAAWFETSGA
jgi:hypothetical protein